MHPIRIAVLFYLVSSLLIPNPLKAESDTAHSDTIVVLKFNIRSEIEPSVWRTTKKAFALADKVHADVILIEMNTYGGMLDIADSVRTKLLDSKRPVIDWINNNAASAGALISIACDKIYMARGANIGAASVVDQNGKILPEKYQSYMRSLMRSTAKASGRNPEIAEAMVDPDIAVKGVIPKGKILTFTRDEAMKNGYCNGKAESVAQVLKEAGYQHYRIVKLRLNMVDKVIHFLTNPVISGILIMIIIFGIYFEFHTPGIGFPIIAAAIAAVLFFAPLYLERLAQSWEILLFLAGVILLALEIFVIPGFGITGISGIIFILAGLILSLVHNNYFDFTFTSDDRIIQAVLTVMIAFTGSIMLMLVLGRRIISSSPFQSLVLNTSLSTKDAYKNIILQKESLEEKTGKAVTDLRPGGKAEIEGEIYDVVSEGGYVPVNSRIKVLHDFRTRIVVRMID